MYQQEADLEASRSPVCNIHTCDVEISILQDKYTNKGRFSEVSNTLSIV